VLDEFEDNVEIEELPESGGRSDGESPERPLAARLVSRLYGAAGASLRTRMLACLVRPLGSLGLAAVASGAFAQLLYRTGDTGAGIPIMDLAGYTNEQIFELARFVEQVSPDAIQQVAGMLADNPIGLSAFTTAVAMLLVRVVRGIRPRNAAAEGKAAPMQIPELASANRGDPVPRNFGHGSTTALKELVRRTRERPAPDPLDEGRPQADGG
jgi:hypothetical protein